MASRAGSFTIGSLASLMVRCGTTSSKAPPYGGKPGNSARTASVSATNGAAGSGARSARGREPPDAFESDIEGVEALGDRDQGEPDGRNEPRRRDEG